MCVHVCVINMHVHITVDVYATSVCGLHQSLGLSCLAEASSVDYNSDTSRLFVGLDNGTISVSDPCVSRMLIVSV